MMKLLTLTMIAAGLAAAQTFTQQVSQPQICPNVDGCTYESLVAPNGDTGRLAIGYPAPQLVYNVPGNPNSEAQYCDGGTFTGSQSVNSAGQTVYVRDCNSNADGVQGNASGHLHWEITATPYHITQCGRYRCDKTWWTIDSMFVTLTLQ